jgi:hypothetical protein
MKRLSPAARFWIGLGAYVLFADGFLWRRQHNTMSVQWGTWLQTPKGRYACIAAWAGLTAHLFLGMPLPGQKTLKSVMIGTRRNKKTGELELIVLEKGALDA